MQIVAKLGKQRTSQLIGKLYKGLAIERMRTIGRQKKTPVNLNHDPSPAKRYEYSWLGRRATLTSLYFLE
jgi:hypothetical protein